MPGKRKTRKGRANFFTRCVRKVQSRSGVSLLRAERICGAAAQKKRRVSRGRKAKTRRRRRR